MRIEVTEDDIQIGRPRCPEFCAVARAIERETSQITKITWRQGQLYITVGSREIEAPEDVWDFVDQFDDKTYDPREHLEPFDFELPDLDSPKWKPI